MLSNFSNRTELYCKVQIYNNLSPGYHIVVIRLPHDYMTIDEIEKYAKNQCESKYISFIKIIGVGVSI